MTCTGLLSILLFLSQSNLHSTHAILLQSTPAVDNRTLAVDNRTAIIHNLLAWARHEGGFVDNIAVGSSYINGAGRALTAVNPRNKGNVLVSVPLHILITDIVARADPLVQQHVLSFPSSVLTIDSCMSVTLFLMIEQLALTKIHGPNSKWFTYFKSLPPLNHRFNLPQLEWNSTIEGKKALDVLLSSPSMAQRIYTEQKLHTRALATLKATVFRSLNAAYPQLNYEILTSTFLWAKSIILTRSWTKPHSSIPG